MRATSRLLENRQSFSIWEIGRDRLEELTQFVFSIYYSHFATDGWQDPDGDLRHMIDDDRAYAPHARVFAAVGRSGAILSTGRILEHSVVGLPIERDFSIPVLDTARTLAGERVVNRIFEVARLATSSSAIAAESISRATIPEITDSIIQQITLTSSHDSGNFWVASMDNRALGLFRHRGFAFEQLAETDPNYLGSPTTPVMLSIDACREAFRAESRAKHDHYFSRPSTQFATARGGVLTGASGGTDLTDATAALAA